MDKLAFGSFYDKKQKNKVYLRSDECIDCNITQFDDLGIVIKAKKKRGNFGLGFITWNSIKFIEQYVEESEDE